MSSSVAVVGCGHVGSVTAACLAHLGHEVVGLDVARELVDELNGGRAPFLEPGLDDLLATNIAAGRLAFSVDPAVLAAAEFIFICVDTPRFEDAADLRKLHASLQAIASAMDPRREAPTVVLKSTTPLGIADQAAATLLSLAGTAVEVVVNPEFLRQGAAVADFLHPDRIVIGADSTIAGERVAALYRGVEAPVISTDRLTAEMIKHAANAFLATRVSFINEMARLSDVFGADIDAVIAGVGADPRLGSSFLSPGIGFGGSCLPRDVAALITSASERRLQSPLLSAVREVNEGQRTAARDALAAGLGGLKARRVAVWGATYKQGSEDTRDSPAIHLIQLLLDSGAEVAVFDPALRDASLLPDGAEFRTGALDCCEAVDAVALLTDWPEFRDVDLADVRRRMRGDLLFDGRNALDPGKVRSAGLRYMGIGRRTHDSQSAPRGANER